MDAREKCCCFTGNRKVSASEVTVLKQRLDTTLDRLINSGYTTFLTGGALGFDTVAALAILHKKKKNPNLRLILCLPCPNQDKYWTQADKAFYKYILERADEVHYACQIYVSFCMHKRNRFMVDNSSYCVAFCRNEKAPHSGTASTMSYARKHGVTVENIF